MPDGNSGRFQRLVDLLIGAKIAIALRAMAEYEIADKLASGPKPVEILAQETALNEDVLRRVLWALAQYEVFRETPDGRFENSDLSQYMRSDAEPSLRASILLINHNVSLRACLQLEQSLKDGKSHFVDVNDAPFFELFVDLEMLVHFGGKERTELEYDKLVRGAGFSVERVVPIKDSFFSVIEVAPA